MTYTSRAIEPFKLLQESFSQTGPIYLPLLLLAAPAQVLSTAQRIATVTADRSLSYGLSLLSVVVGLIMTGTVMHFVYKYLRERTIDLSGAFGKGIGMFLNLLIGYIIYILVVVVGCILLVIPGIYISVVLGFFIYAMVSENCSFMDAFKYSMDLVKGRWWEAFGSMIVDVLWVVPVVMVAALVIPIIYISMALLFIIPFMNMYYMKLFMRMQETAAFNQ